MWLIVFSGSGGAGAGGRGLQARAASALPVPPNPRQSCVLPLQASARAPGHGGGGVGVRPPAGWLTACSGPPVLSSRGGPHACFSSPSPLQKKRETQGKSASISSSLFNNARCLPSDRSEIEAGWAVEGSKEARSSGINPERHTGRLLDHVCQKGCCCCFLPSVPVFGLNFPHLISFWNLRKGERWLLVTLQILAGTVFLLTMDCYKDAWIGFEN